MDVQRAPGVEPRSLAAPEGPQLITVGVPADRVTEFHVMFGCWLAMQTSVSEPADRELSPAAGRPWGVTATDLELAFELWDQLAAPARKIVQHLMARPNIWVRADELAKYFNNDRYKVAGLLGAPVKFSKDRNMAAPVQLGKDPLDGQTTYRMVSEVIELFRAAEQATAQPA